MADNGTLGGRNPFVIKTSATPTKNEDVSAKESRPLIAPPVLVLGNEQDSSRASGFVLKPSSLSAQASNLKLYNTPTTLNCGRTCELSVASCSENVDQPSSIKDSSSDGTVREACAPLKVRQAANSDQQNSLHEHESRKTPFSISKENTKRELAFNKNYEDRVSSVPAILGSITEAKECNFVFGQNLRERVANADLADMEDPKETSSSKFLTFAAASSGMSSATSVGKEIDSDSFRTALGDGKLYETKRSLTETAGEIQMRLENEAKRSRLNEVEIITGEENESNVLQISCKLYVYEDAQYQERGRGCLRLNDKQSSEDGSIQSRVVMRTKGILRVVLNTKVWAGMAVEHPSARTVRLTGQSANGTSGVFLVQCGSPKDADQLFNALEWRVQALKRQVLETTGQTASKSESEEHKQEVACDRNTNKDDGNGHGENDEEGNRCKGNFSSKSGDSVSESTHK